MEKLENKEGNTSEIIKFDCKESPSLKKHPKIESIRVK
jgi:hypothetical protein